MKKVLILNSSIGIIQVLVSSILYLATIPIFLKCLGNELYGVFALITTLGTVGLFINFGFNLSIIKFIGEQGIGVESDRDIILSFLLASSFVFTITFIGIVFNYQIIDNFLSIPDKYLTDETFSFFNFVILSNSLVFIGQVLTAILDSQQKIYLSSVLQLGLVVVNRIGIMIVLFLGWHLYEVGVVILSSTILWFAALIWIVARNWKFTSHRGLFNGFFLRLKKHFAYGSKVYLTSISGFFYEPFAKILIGKYIGIVEVGAFDIGFRIKSLVWSLIEKSLYPLLPLIAGRTDKASNLEIVDWVSRRLLLLCIPIIGITYFILPPCIELWLKLNNEQIVFTAQVLLCGYLFTSTGLPMYVFLMMQGHLEKTFYIQTLNALLSLLFFIASVPFFGYQGAVYSFMVSVICTHFLLLYFQRKYLNSNIFRPISLTLKSLITGAIIITANFIIQVYFIVSIQLLVVYFVVDLILLVLFFKIFKIFTSTDLYRIVGEDFTIKLKQKSLFR